jgi:hypothetical protein
MKINDLSEQFFLVTDSCQVSEIQDFLNIDMQRCDSLFVRLDRDGNAFETVYGFEGTVPLLDKMITPLFPRPA